MNQELGLWGHDGSTGRIADDEGDAEEDIVYDDDEDEFGLPSIASMRKRQSRKTDVFQPKAAPLGILEDKPSTLGVNISSNRQRANSSDIAEERDIPLYPTTRKGDGKILRPQYKDILKGTPQHFLNKYLNRSNT